MWIKFQDVLIQAEMGYFYKNDDDYAHYAIVFKTDPDNFYEEFSTKKQRDDRFQEIEDLVRGKKSTIINWIKFSHTLICFSDGYFYKSIDYHTGQYLVVLVVGKKGEKFAQFQENFYTATTRNARFSQLEKKFITGKKRKKG